MRLRNYGCRVSDAYTFHGYKAVIIENELLRIGILVDKGTDIFEFVYKPLDLDFMWRNPLGFRNPDRFIPTVAAGGGSFTDYYFGGWQEIFPVGGWTTEYKGAEFGLHSETPLLPWKPQIILDTEEEVAVKFSVRTVRSPYSLVKTLRLKANEAILHIDETVTNEGEEEMHFMWGHHPAFGGRFLDENCVIDVPAKNIESAKDPSPGNRVAPGEFSPWPMIKRADGLGKVDLSIIPPKSDRSMDMCFLTDLEAGWYALTNQKLQTGFGMTWDHNFFKHIWYWMVFGGAYGYPSYGRYYTLALEPWTSYATAGGFHQILKEGGAVRIAPGASISTSMKAIAYTGVTGVKSISPEGIVTGK